MTRNKISTFTNWQQRDNKSFPLITEKLETKTASFAERELDILLKTTPDAIIRDFIPELLALCEAFGKSGQSGGSAPYTAGALSGAIKKLCMQQPICPIMGIDEEWSNEIAVSERDLYQNTRCYALFKEGKTADPYYLDAIVWKTQNESTWSGYATHPDGSKIKSRQFIKGFPFEPKTFTIDVIEKEIGKDDWEFIIKDPKQLDEVYEYYKKPTKDSLNESVNHERSQIWLLEGMVFRKPLSDHIV